MDPHPLYLSAPSRPLVFGGREIARRLGKQGLGDWAIAETWEVSDVDGNQSEVLEGPLAGNTLRQLVVDHPRDLMGPRWSGSFFPLLSKFIDASGTLPVHLHADDDTARSLEGQVTGKTEAWHILWAAPGATALCGLKRGVGYQDLRAALLDQDFDRVCRRLPVRAGETIYVPGGTLHSFGPDTLVYEIEQTSDIQQHAMRWNMEDGSAVSEEQWRANLDALLDEVDLDPRPEFHPGLRIGTGDGVQRLICCAGPYFALERWTAGTAEPLVFRFTSVRILSNVGAPVHISSGSWSGTLGRAQTVVLPAVLGMLEVHGPADLLLGYLPDLERDIIEPLTAAGHAPAAIAALGEGLVPDGSPAGGSHGTSQ